MNDQWKWDGKNGAELAAHLGDENSDLRAEVARLKAERDNYKAQYEDDLRTGEEHDNDLWQLIYPGKTDWEYPGMVWRHIKLELEDRQKRGDTYRARALALMAIVRREHGTGGNYLLEQKLKQLDAAEAEAARMRAALRSIQNSAENVMYGTTHPNMQFLNWVANTAYVGWHGNQADAAPASAAEQTAGKE